VASDNNFIHQLRLPPRHKACILDCRNMLTPYAGRRATGPCAFFALDVAPWLIILFGSASTWFVMCPVRPIVSVGHWDCLPTGCPYADKSNALLFPCVSSSPIAAASAPGTVLKII